MPSLPLQVAEHALLDERRPLTRDEVGAVAALPLDELPDLIALAHKVRLAYCGAEVELESLINAKSGRVPRGLRVLLAVGEVRHRRRRLPVPRRRRGPRRRRAATRAAGATQFCIVVAVRGPDRAAARQGDRGRRRGARRDRPRGRVLARAARRRSRPSGSPTAGVSRYNHNLEAPRGVPVDLHHAHLRRPGRHRAARDRRGHGAVLRRHPRHGRDARPADRLRVRARRARAVRGADQLPAAVAARRSARSGRSRPARRCRRSRCSGSCCRARGCGSPAAASTCSASCRAWACSPARTR